MSRCKVFFHIAVAGSESGGKFASFKRTTDWVLNTFFFFLVYFLYRFLNYTGLRRCEWFKSKINNKGWTVWEVYLGPYQKPLINLVCENSYIVCTPRPPSPLSAGRRGGWTSYPIFKKWRLERTSIFRGGDFFQGGRLQFLHKWQKEFINKIFFLCHN